MSPSTRLSPGAPAAPLAAPGSTCSPWAALSIPVSQGKSAALVALLAKITEGHK
jgi:hypothetical protein